ncbi:TatD family hydrolase [Aliamphritea spongicola]|uniref:TatD family hydrolase n=1 Tax=Aliamphritea spongicola TaxID=707589 RepID=UPI00196B7AB7|nr:TatD family hydrolase [Aliamphritea spongicola]MBN3560555.1 TatD family hydrolase [Aliamphritea spongicola]
MRTFTPQNADQVLIDIGVNLSDSSFSKDWHEVAEQAALAGVSPLILTGTNMPENHQCLEMCQQSSVPLFTTAGVHPHSASEYSADTTEQLRQLLKEDKVVAVGETGLDFNRNFSPPEAQIYAFEQQLELAAETGLPLFLHERDAHQKQLEMLSAFREHISGGVAHCFTGTREELYNYLDLDLYIGITGWICDERRGSHLHPLLKDIPADRLMLETDAPYLLPRDIRPKPKSRRNTPLNLPHILQVVAELVGKTAEQVARESRATSLTFFNLQNRV